MFPGPSGPPLLAVALRLLVLALSVRAHTYRAPHLLHSPAHTEAEAARGLVIPPTRWTAASTGLARFDKAATAAVLPVPLRQPVDSRSLQAQQIAPSGPAQDTNPTTSPGLSTWPAGKPPPAPAPCPPLTKTSPSNLCFQSCPDYPKNATWGKCQHRCSGGCCSFAWSANVPYAADTNRSCPQYEIETEFGNCTTGSCNLEESLKYLPVDECLSVCTRLSDGTVIAQDSGGGGTSVSKTAAVEPQFEGACISGPCEGNVSYTLYVVRQLQPEAGNVGAGSVMQRQAAKVVEGTCAVNDCVAQSEAKCRCNWMHLALAMLTGMLFAKPYI